MDAIRRRMRPNLQVVAHSVDGGVKDLRVAARVAGVGIGGPTHKVEPPGAVAVGVERLERVGEPRVSAGELIVAESANSLPTALPVFGFEREERLL